MIPAYAITGVPVAPIRSEPKHSAEQVSQLLFGEKVEVWAKKPGDWCYVRAAWDDYEGWVKAGQLQSVDSKVFKKKTRYLSAGTQDTLLLPTGKTLLSPGSSLFNLRKSIVSFGNIERRYKGKKIKLNTVEQSGRHLVEFAGCFLGSPYLWGGRHLLGIDCSGLTQLAYKFLDIPLPRDAAQQAQQGEPVDFLQNAQAGDLAFFDNEEGVINHVGILTDPANILHATDTVGCVVLDAIDNCGIISRGLKVRTHNLRMIRRYLTFEKRA